MTELERFLEPIKISGEPLNGKYKAYRMDGTSPYSDMRKTVGLGTCNCCDYFTFATDNTIAMIEETRLLEQFKHLQDKYNYLDAENRKAFIDECITDENKLKVYGSMLVLCRLTAQYESVKERLLSKKYRFWLVVSDMDKEEDARTFDYLKGELLGDLKSALTGKVVKGVEIIPATKFADKLTQNAASP